MMSELNSIDKTGSLLNRRNIQGVGNVRLALSCQIRHHLHIGFKIISNTNLFPIVLCFVFLLYKIE